MNPAGTVTRRGERVWHDIVDRSPENEDVGFAEADSTPVCCFFLRGKCARRSCKYLHEDCAGVQCNYGERCSYHWDRCNVDARKQEAREQPVRDMRGQLREQGRVVLAASLQEREVREHGRESCAPTQAPYAQDPEVAAGLAAGPLARGTGAPMLAGQSRALRVFVSGLARTPVTRYEGGIDEEDNLGHFFYNRGCNVDDVRLMVDPSSSVCRGFGFVDFEDDESLQKALSFAGQENPEGVKLDARAKGKLLVEVATPAGADVKTKQRELQQACRKTEDIEVAAGLAAWVALQGGRVSCFRLSMYYSAHPDHKSVIGRGGRKVRDFCEQHPALLKFVADGGPWWIVLPGLGHGDECAKDETGWTDWYHLEPGFVAGPYDLTQCHHVLGQHSPSHWRTVGSAHQTAPEHDTPQSDQGEDAESFLDDEDFEQVHARELQSFLESEFGGA